jgi:hypothetical protein
MHTVRRFALAFIVAALSISASGLSSLIVGEPCAGFSVAAEHDSDCPPTCVTCGCCAQAVEPAMFASAGAPDAPVPDFVAVLPPVPNAHPLDILHVPKPRSA